MNSSNEEDIIEAKAEARRLKILANSKARLEKISNRKSLASAACNDNIDNPASNKTTSSEYNKNQIYPDPQIDRIDTTDNYHSNSSNFSTINHLDTQQVLFDLVNNINRSGSGGGQAINSNLSFINQQKLFKNSSKSEAFRQQLPFFVIFLKTKLHIALLSLVTYVLIQNGIISFGANVFLLFLLWELVEVLILKPYETNKPSFLSLLFILGGLPTVHSTTLLKFIETFYKITRDMAIFMFVFVFSHILCNTLIFTDHKSIGLLWPDVV